MGLLRCTKYMYPLRRLCICHLPLRTRRDKRRSTPRVQWFHVDCAFRAFSRTKTSTNTIRTTAGLCGIDQIMPRDKELVMEYIGAWVTSMPARENGDELAVNGTTLLPPLPAIDDELFLRCCDFLIEQEQLLLGNNAADTTLD